MTMQLFQLYNNQPIMQLRQSVLTQVGDSHQPTLDYLLDLVVLKTVSQLLDASMRQHALSLLRADPNRLSVWLEQNYPLSRLTITEALTRVLLSLTVE